VRADHRQHQSDGDYQLLDHFHHFLPVEKITAKTPASCFPKPAQT